MYGFNGKVLIIDLTDKTYEIKPLDPEWAKNFVGGAALGARFLYELMPAGTPVFAPESVIGFVSGPTNATKAFMGARYTIVSKSPVTGGWNDANSGGSFGPYMRKSGFDAVFIKGISEKPVYVFIDNGNVEFRDAQALWGKTVSDTEDAIKQEINDKNIGISLIGPAGESLSNMAAVMCDSHRAAARGGSGAVMGSKNLKALVCRGNNRIQVMDEEAILAINKECIEHGKDRAAVPVGKFKTTGTGSDYDSSVLLADAGIKNWAGSPEDMTDEQISALTSAAMDPLYKQGQTGCESCYIRCGAIYKLVNEKYNIEHTYRPEYESLGAFGSMLTNGDSDCAVVCNWLCNEYGYDTLSFGGTIAWLMECFNKGIFTVEELDGVDLKWGDADAIIAIAEKICKHEGIGEPLNRASRAAAEYFKKGQECLVHAGGIEIPMHGARYNPGLARTFQYDPTPGRHVKGGLGVPYGHKPPEVKYNYNNTGERDIAGLQEWEVSNMSGLCSFHNFLLAPGANFKYLAAITGVEYSKEERDELAYRAFTIRYAFNLREGFRRKDFTISDRSVGKPPLERGPVAGITVDNELLADNFFNALGWNVEEGIPTKEFLDRLGGLECVVKDLY